MPGAAANGVCQRRKARGWEQQLCAATVSAPHTAAMPVDRANDGRVGERVGRERDLTGRVAG